MPKHACETFDFPLAFGLVNYTTTKKLNKKGGGTWQIATQEAIDEARQSADDAGKAALKNDTCADPCECLVFVDTSLGAVQPTWLVKGKSLSITVTGYWKAGVLCVKPHAKDHGKDGDKKHDDKPGDKKHDGKAGGESDKKPKKKKARKADRA